MKTGLDKRVMAAVGTSFLLCMIAVAWSHVAAQGKKGGAPPVPGPMLEQGMIELSTPDFNLSLVRSSQTIAGLKPKGAGEFNFTPADRLMERSQNGYHHLGISTCACAPGMQANGRTTRRRSPARR